jgi:uncharacterized membrane protein
MKTTITKILYTIKSFPVLLITLAVIGLVASAIISIEKTQLLRDPDATLSCSINPVYSCSSVVLSDQAEIFGFSNELIGIAFFAGVLALALGMLAGATYRSWLYKLLWLGLVGSMIMVIWFFYQSVYNINALCIYCSVTWFATWSMFVLVSRWMLVQDIVVLPKKALFIKKAIVEYPYVVWVSLIALFAALILNHFWYYYGQYF